MNDELTIVHFSISIGGGVCVHAQRFPNISGSNHSVLQTNHSRTSFRPYTLMIIRSFKYGVFFSFIVVVNGWVQCTKRWAQEHSLHFPQPTHPPWGPIAAVHHYRFFIHIFKWTKKEQHIGCVFNNKFSYFLLAWRNISFVDPHNFCDQFDFFTEFNVSVWRVFDIPIVFFSSLQSFGRWYFNS